MRGIRDARRVKGFMIIQKISKNNYSGKVCRPLVVILMGVLLCTGVNSCTPELTDDSIPYFTFAPITINLTLPEYQSLRSDGGWKYIDEGVRGIIVYRMNSSTYMAYERNCSFQPNNACATVDVHSSQLYMSDACCNSTFEFTAGKPTGGPAWRPLNRYETILNGLELTITSELEP